MWRHAIHQHFLIHISSGTWTLPGWRSQRCAWQGSTLHSPGFHEVECLTVTPLDGRGVVRLVACAHTGGQDDAVGVVEDAVSVVDDAVSVVDDAGTQGVKPNQAGPCTVRIAYTTLTSLDGVRLGWAGLSSCHPTEVFFYGRFPRPWPVRLCRSVGVCSAVCRPNACSSHCTHARLSMVAVRFAT